MNVDIRKQVADEFNTYFSQVGCNLAKAINSRGPVVVDDSDYSVLTTFTMTTINDNDLARHVTSLRGNSAPGYDCISADFLKQHLTFLSKPLIHIINMSLSSGKFPNAFKLAKVIPIYKSSDVKEVTNFRPISLLSVFSKVLEKVLKEQFVNYVE